MYDQQTQFFIRDRALSLAYEAVQFPATAEVALAWLDRAVAQAEQNSLKDLAEDLRASIRRIAGQEESTLNFVFETPDGQKVFLPAWAGEGEV